MAHNGVPDDTLLLFSGHTNVAMLKRYLDDGRIGLQRATASRNAATYLLGGPASA